jgi:hypothetical protein
MNDEQWIGKDLIRKGHRLIQSRPLPNVTTRGVSAEDMSATSTVILLTYRV